VETNKKTAKEESAKLSFAWIIEINPYHVILFTGFPPISLAFIIVN
jgi:hypothetical protein